MAMASPTSVIRTKTVTETTSRTFATSPLVQVEQMRHPIPEEKVYICGDAYSNDQGWAEGALETAELIITKDLNDENQVEEFVENWKVDLMRRKKY